MNGLGRTTAGNVLYVGPCCSKSRCAVAVYLLLCALQACVSYGASTSTLPRFEPLQQRQLVAFQFALNADRQAQHTSEWTLVADAWNSLVSCRPIMVNMDELRSDLTRLQLGLITLEAQRRQYLQRIHALRGTVFADWQDAEFFVREGVKARISNPLFIRWPPEAEAWADEALTSAAVQGTCSSEMEENAEPASSLRSIAKTLLESIEETLSRLIGLPHVERSMALRRTRTQLILFGAQLSTERYWAEGRSRFWYDAGARLYGYRSLLMGADLALMELNNAVMHYVVAADDPALLKAGLTLFVGIEDTGLSTTNLWLLRYGVLLAGGASSKKNAGHAGTALPPRDHLLFPAFAYRAAQLALERGDEAHFLALAMEALRDEGTRGDHFLQALYRGLLLRLVVHDFVPETVEVLEETGPRNELYRRVVEFSEMALQEGLPEVALKSTSWLLQRDHDRRHHAGYYRLRAQAAFAQDDKNGFERALHRLTDRPTSLLAVVPRGRRAAFFSGADTALTRLFVQILPKMAEWGVDPKSLKRRQKWLGITVMAVQEFLRTTDETGERRALLQMYRLASSLLSTHPRGYAEHVGAVQHKALVLGDVQVQAMDLSAFEPQLRVSFDSPYLLAPIPVAEDSLARWTLNFAGSIEDHNIQQKEQRDG